MILLKDQLISFWKEEQIILKSVKRVLTRSVQDKSQFINEFRIHEIAVVQKDGVERVYIKYESSQFSNPVWKEINEDWEFITWL